jgi:hypothetical protein
MFMKKPKPKSFDFQPRYYNPGKDPEEMRKRKLGFKRNRKIVRRRGSTVYFMVIFIIVLYIYLKFLGVF